MRRVKQLTRIYMSQGMGILEARIKAENRVKFEKSIRFNDKAPKLHPCAGK